MSDNQSYALHAILQELNKRQLRKRLSLFRDDQRFHVMLASSIIGHENAKRLGETPEAVIEDGEGFISKLLGLASPEQDDAFREILETYLIETLRDELQFSCLNCRHFNACIDLENLPVGTLFRRHVEGEETEELKAETRRQVELALRKTPYIDSEEAHRLCIEFEHQYSASSIGELFGRYADIAVSLQTEFGINYRKIQEELISLNMLFYEESSWTQ